MADKSAESDLSDVEARRSASSSRRLGPGRRLFYFLGLPVLFGAVKLLWWSYRVEKLIGAEIADKLLAEGTVCTPCYWHRDLVLGNWLIYQWIRRGFRAGFTISASVDGDVPSRIARRWGAAVVRGSSNNTGALVLRDVQARMKEGVSFVAFADGPTGPKYHFKAGVVLMARIGHTPMVPIGCAADRAWHLNRWDDFVIPKPFARVVLAVGDPVVMPEKIPVNEMEAYRLRMENAVNSLVQQSKDELARLSE